MDAWMDGKAIIYFITIVSISVDDGEDGRECVLEHGHADVRVKLIHFLDVPYFVIRRPKFATK
jgi:hypothetical protein